MSRRTILAGLLLLAACGTSGFYLPTHETKYGMSEEEREAAIAAQPEPVRTQIRSGKVYLGFTKEQVVLTWGKPLRVNRHGGSWGVHEQWVYANTYLYFRDGKLSSYQD